MFIFIVKKLAKKNGAQFKTKMFILKKKLQKNLYVFTLSKRNE